MSGAIEHFESAIPPLTTQDPRIRVGRFTYGNPRFMIWAETDQIEIGAFCSIAENVTIFGGGEHNTDWVTTFPLRIAFGDPLSFKDGHPATKGNTKIGNDVWIAYGAIILSGVSIGDGAVIGAGSVVTKDVPAYSIVGGNPARFIRQRFSAEQAESLQKIQWWNWPESRIRAFAPLLCSNNVDEFIRSAQAGT